MPNPEKTREIINPFNQEVIATAVEGNAEDAKQRFKPHA